MNWNKERLIEKYMDNASSVSVAAGVSTPSRASPSVSGPAPIRSSGTRRRTMRQAPGALSTTNTSGAHPYIVLPIVSKAEPSVCPICFDDSQTSFLAFSCDHSFCVSCWAAYMTSKIREEGEHAIRCMAEGCALVAPDPFVISTLAKSGDDEDGRTRERFQELLVRHFVSANPHLKYCPYPSCTYTVSCPSASSRSSLTTMVPTVSCGANHKFCFGCNIDSDHRPVICPVAKMWLKKCRDDSETANWIKSNTKECSKCQSTIEKNGGCKYVSFVGV
jgi:ariadne-1